MAETRIYVVTDSQEGTTKLVEATSQSAAIAQVVQARYSAKAATPKEVASFYRPAATSQTTQPNAPQVQ